MKVLFIHTNKSKCLQIPMGMAYISGYLKSKGIETFLWDNTFETIDELKTKVKTINPDFICMGALSPDYEWACKIAYMLREITKAKIIIGGSHATFSPIEIINENCFDVVIRGDGEYSVYEYITTLNNKTPGAWVKEEDKIYMNPVGIVPDVNELPWPDHEMFKRHFEKRLAWAENEYNKVGVFITARGCPFKCTYCGCNNLHKLYSGQRVTRYRNIDSIIEEIKVITKRYGVDLIWFTDETFTVNKKRIIELCKRYKSQIGISFACCTRVDTVNEEVLIAMKEAGCVLVCMGIESGVDRIRNDLYKKNVSREKIIDSFKMAKKLGIRTSSFNICGAPTETAADIRETIKLNQECQVDIGKMTIFNVFPGSEITKYCKDNGYYIRSNYPDNYYIDSNFRHDTLSINDLIGLRKEFVDSVGGYTGSEKEGEV